MTTTPIAAGPNDVTVRAAIDAGIAVMAGNMAALADAPTWNDLEAFANLIAASEREACAKVCEEVATRMDEDGAYVRNPHVSVPQDGCDECAVAIRERSNAAVKGGA